VCCAIGVDANKHMPFLFIKLVSKDNREIVFLGDIEYSGESIFSENIRIKMGWDKLSKIYFDEALNGNENNDWLMRQFGLRYCVVSSEGDVVELCNNTINKYKKNAGLMNFVNNNIDFTSELVSDVCSVDVECDREYREFLISFAEQKISVSIENPIKRKSYFPDVVDKCDVCERDLQGRDFMVDAVAPNLGGGCGCMCALCFEQVGGKLGMGYGQLYKRDENGWLLVAGYK
jgi:hypothetical protein